MSKYLSNNLVQLCRVKKSFCYGHSLLHQDFALFNSMIEQTLKLCYEYNRLTKEDIAARNNVRLALLQHFHQSTSSMSTFVHSFGSTVNGFGFKRSDLDFYVSGIDSKTTYKALKNSSEFSGITAVRCRVPLVTFHHVETGLRGDLSFNNSIGVHNSKMLSRYSNVSMKCRYIVYALKYLTKRCKIADAQHNFLSSYTYTIMAIHYLQQLEQPILPVLQEIKSPDLCDEYSGKYTVDGYHAYYFAGNNSSLKRLWPEFGKNQQSLSEIFIGLLRYYAEEFDFSKHAVCIHKLNKPEIPRRRAMVIYDPFENERNLGVPLSKSSSRLIQGVFQNAYKHFTTLPSEPIDTYYLLNYFFNPKVLLGDYVDRHWFFHGRQAKDTS